MANSLALVWDLLAIDNASRVFEKVGLSAESAGLKAEGAGKRLATGLLGATAVVTGIGVESVKMAGDFEAAMTRLMTSAGESKGNLKLVGDGILEMAGQVGISATDLAKGMYIVESAGYHGADALNVLKASAQGAKTENADLGTVANAVSTIMRDFGASAGDATHVTSTLISAVSVGKTNFQDLSGAMHAVMPRAAALHMSFPELAADLATMTAHGMSAEQSAQNLNGALRNLSNPTLAMSKRMADFGIQSHDVSANLSKDGLQGTLEKLSATIMDRMGPAGAELKSVWNQSNLAATDAQKMFDALSPKARKLAQDYRDGKIQMHDWTVGVKTMDTANGNLLKQWAAQENASKGFSTALKTGGDTVKTYTGALSGMVGGQEATTVALMLTGDQAKFATDNIKTVTGATNDASGAVKGFGEQQQTLNGKIADMRGAVSALMITLGNQLVPAAKEAFDNLNQIFGQFAKGWREGFAEIGRRLVANLTETGVMLREKMGEIWAKLLRTVADNNDAIRDYMLARWADIRRNASEWWNGVLADISGVWAKLVRTVVENNDTIRDFLLARWADIRRNASAWWNGILADISDVWNLLVQRVRDNSDAVRDYLLARWSDIKTNATAWWNGIVAGITGIWDGFLRWIGDKVGGLGRFLAGAWDTIKGAASGAWQDIVDTIGGIWGKVVENFKGPLNAVLGFVQDHFIGPLQSLLDGLHVSIKLPTVPQFADGGLASIPTGAARHAAGGSVGGWSPHDRADNIPAWLTAREWVQPVDAVDYYGTGVMEALQHKLIPRGLFAGEGHADGGLVRGYADGGSVWDAIKTGLGVAASQTANPITSIASAVTANPLDAIKKIVSSIVGGIGSGPFPQIAGAVLTQAGDALAQQVKDFLTAANQNGASSTASDGAGAASAVQWALGHVGSSGWLDKCLAFVNAAWGHKVNWLGLPRAIDAWNAAPEKHSDTNPPAGAALFYNTGNPAGHVDLAVGQNSIVSTDLPTRDLLGQVDFNRPMSQWGAKYLGWAIPGGSVAAVAAGSGSGNIAYNPSAGVLQWANNVMAALGRTGQPSSLMNTTLRRMQQESGGNPNAINLWDSNAKAGTPSKGLMQMIDPTFQRWKDPSLPNNIWDADANITGSMRYAIGNYGSLASAFNRPGGYADGGVVKFDTGGWLQPGFTAAYNGTGKPERVRTAEQEMSGGGTFHLYDVSGVLIGTMRGEIARADRAAQLTAAAGSSVAIR